MKRPMLALLAVLGVGRAEINVAMLGIDRLENGNTVFAAEHFNTCDSGLVLEVDSAGHIVWGTGGGGLLNVHTARRLPNGNTLVSATSADRVIEFDRAGLEVWSVDTGLSYPNEAYRLENGNTLITDRHHNRVIEVTPGGEIAWSYDDLVLPHNGNRLGNGNTLICDSDRDAVVEISPAGSVVWRCDSGLDWPRAAQRLANGNTLITDSRHDRVVEVDAACNVVWTMATSPGLPYMAERLTNGRTLVSASGRMYEVDSSGNVLWQWPGADQGRVEETWVRNPSTGLMLWGEVHHPPLAPGVPAPAVLLVPDDLHPGAVYDTNGLADLLALSGFAAVHFDPDGRGRSEPFPEDYYGRINQDGLQACIDALAEIPDIDTARIGILAEGYGITLASGMLAGSADPQRVKFLLDFEGPADRFQSFVDSGGCVPIPLEDTFAWQEREAARFMSRVPCIYLRVQTEQDHNPHITDNRHCIALVDSATAGLPGCGISPWTRVNDSAMNEPNRRYTLEDPPVWIPESGESFTPFRYLLYLREIMVLLEPTPARETTPSGGPARDLVARPNPFRLSTVLDLGCAPGTRAEVRVFDASGRLVRALAANGSRAAWDGRDEGGTPVGPGVYYCRVAGSVRVAKLVRLGRP